MRIRILRRRPLRISNAFFLRRRGRASSGQRVFLRLLLIAVSIFIILMLAAARIRPVIAVLARSEARDFVIRAINDAITYEMEQGNLEYGKLVTLQKDSNGNITALVTNSVLINMLQTRISNNVVERVENVVDANMGIPIGNAISGVMFAGRGPRIPIRIPSVTNVDMGFTNEFSSVGINQTRHNIMFEISVEVDIIIPGERERTVVTTEVVIAETVIVGIVPNVYADIGGLLR